jgi:NADPH:quinone reductase-like Zn-dependent oxidoreductase
MFFRICFVTAVSSIVITLEIPLPFLSGLPQKGKEPASILILGGSSGTGAATIQLLREAYPSLPIFTTSSTKHHPRLRELGATQVFDYKSKTLVGEIKGASPKEGIDVIFDAVSAGANQNDISDVLGSNGSRKYVALMTGVPISTPDDVTQLESTAWNIFDVDGGKELLPSLTKLVEDGKYKVPLPVNVVGHGLEEVPKGLDAVQAASGQKVVVTL